MLLSAASRLDLQPDQATLEAYHKKRLARAVKALRSRNVFLYTEGVRTSLNPNDITTIYTQPAGVRMLVMGYSDNFRFGNTNQPATGAFSETYPEMHRARIVGQDGHALSEDFLAAQSGSSGQPRYTSTLLPVPVLIEADQQIAVDLGYDSAAAARTGEIPTQAFCFFCVKVKDRLTSDDLDTVREIETYIANNRYQRGIYLNCVSPGLEAVHFSTAAINGIANCLTRPANRPLLITGIGSSLGCSKLVITDTADDYSFTLNKPAQSSALMMPNFEDVGIPRSAPCAAPCHTHYFEFPIPHLLKSGAQLAVQAVNNAAGADIDTQDGNLIIFQGVTV